MPVNYGQTLKRLVESISRAKKESIVILAGAGISVAAGIPDFRSKGTGLYSQLERYNLPTPTSMFDLSYYCLRPRPFSSLSVSIFPSYKYKPTMAHHFFKILEDRGLVRFIYTQNIDELEIFAGVSPRRILQCHGSYCKGLYCLGNISGVCTYQVEDQNVFRAAAMDQSVSHCPRCGRVLKPRIVFFGEQLPSEFQLAPEIIGDAEKTSMLLILGTSLTVAPFNFLAEMVPNEALRVLINRDPAGYVNQALRFYANAHPEKTAADVFANEQLMQEALDLVGRDGTDMFLPGDIETTISSLAELMGCKDELVNLKKDCDNKFESLLEKESKEAKEATVDGVTEALVPFFYSESLRVPTSIAITGQTSTGEAIVGMLGFSTKSQLALMQSANVIASENVVVDITRLPSSVFTKFKTILDAIGFSTSTKELAIRHASYHNTIGKCVYAPLNCHWASYCHSFVGIISSSGGDSTGTFNSDVWDTITRWPKSLIAPDISVEEAGDPGATYRAHTSSSLPISHFTDYSLVPLCDTQTLDCELLQDPNYDVSLLTSSPLSRYLAGSGDNAAAGVLLKSTTLAQELDALHFRITPKYDDQLNDLIEKLQRRRESLTDDLKTMAKPYVISELSIQPCSSAAIVSVHYHSPLASKKAAAQELITSSFTGLIKRVAGDLIKSTCLTDEPSGK
ncbi:NAD-dependent deacetylase, Sir2 family protein [Giardia duodenalis]|uniref:NAD-dependent deacetylase, Sir2 family protein n=1 Tax=Giardia intestinalis TaxID=5741 RepID=V6TS19_GIAIN|nr:NAD-dependent deacetylase, Sir2 family protein [Giardia intestinalis]